MNLNSCLDARQDEQQQASRKDIILVGDGEETMLQQTHQRLEGINALQLPLLICNEDRRFVVVEQRRKVGADSAAEQGGARENMQATSD